MSKDDRYECRPCDRDPDLPFVVYDREFRRVVKAYASANTAKAQTTFRNRLERRRRGVTTPDAGRGRRSP